MLSVAFFCFKLSVLLLNVVMLSVLMMNVVMLSVMAPLQCVLYLFCKLTLRLGGFV
jgi:hypothetical protein